MRKLLAHRYFPYAVAVLSCLLLAPAIGTGFQLDDWFQQYRLLGFADPAINLFVFFDGDPAANRARIESGQLAWWASESLRHANFRYLSTLTMQLDHLFWPDSAAMMHVHSLAWLALLVLCIAKLFRATLMPLWLAGFATLLYAIDDARALPAVYLANRNALIAAVFGVLSMYWQIKGRNGWSAFFLALSLAAAEMGLGTLAYLGAYALCLDKDTLWKRASRLWPQGLVFLSWAVIYKWGGFGSSGSGVYVDPLDNPLVFLSVFGERISLLLLGQWTPVPADLGFSVLALVDWWWIGIPLVAVLLIFFVPLLLHSRYARYWALGSILSLIPISATGPQNRLLFFVGIGGAALLVQWVWALAEQDSALPRNRIWRFPAYLFSLFLVLSHLLLAPIVGNAFINFQDQASENMVAALQSVPDDIEIREQTLILLNPPEYVYLVSAIAPYKALHNKPGAKRVRALATGEADMTVTRVDAQTLELELSEGLFPTPFSRYYRGESERFDTGEIIELAGLSVKIVAFDKSGDPRTVRFRFDKALEDSALRWMRYRNGVYKPWRPPALGRSLHVPGETGIFEG